MNWIWYVSFVLFFIILLIIISEVKIHILYDKKKKNDFIEVNLWFFYQFIHLKKKIPIIALESMSEGIKYKSENRAGDLKEEKDKKDRITLEKVMLWKKQYKQFLASIHDFYKVLKRFLKHVYIDKYRWESIIGTGDAMETGVLSGILWGLKGSLLGLISKYIHITKEPILAVKPNFKHATYHSKFECILRFRVGHLILTGIRILLKLHKGGGKKWHKNILSKA